MDKEAATGFSIFSTESPLPCPSLCSVLGSAHCLSQGGGPSTPGLMSPVWILGCPAFQVGRLNSILFSLVEKKKKHLTYSELAESISSLWFCLWFSPPGVVWVGGWDQPRVERGDGAVLLGHAPSGPLDSGQCQRATAEVSPG